MQLQLEESPVPAWGSIQSSHMGAENYFNHNILAMTLKSIYSPESVTSCCFWGYDQSSLPQDSWETCLGMEVKLGRMFCTGAVLEYCCLL